MKLISTLEKRKHINLLLYGKHGSGKTPLSATAPKPFFVSTDEGLLSISDLDIPGSEVRTYEDLEETYDYITSKKGKEFETIILDSGLELVDVVLAQLKSNPELKDKRNAYMQVAEVTKFWIRRFRDLPKNFIMTTVADIITIDDIEKYRPYFSGNVLKREIPGMFNEIFCLHKDKKEKIVLQCRECQDYDARDRSKKLEKYEGFDLTEIFAKIQEGKTKKKKNKNKE